MKTYNIKITRGVTFIFDIDCTQFPDIFDPASTIKAQLRSSDDILLATFIVTKDNINKIVRLNLDANTTFAIPITLNKSYSYDVLINSVTGQIYQLISGNVGFNSVISK